MNSFTDDLSRQSGALELRRVDNKRWQVMTAVGHGRVLTFEEEGMHLEVFHPPWSTYGRRQGPRATYDCAVRCRLGDVLTDGAGALWCLLGGVPLPAPNATADEHDLRLSIALTRVPQALTAISGPLALLPVSLSAPVDGVRAEEADLQQAFGEEVVEMMLRLTREDVTVYSRAVATPSFWLSLLQAMAPAAGNESPEDDDLSPVDEARLLSCPVNMAEGSLPASTLRALSVGDVVRLPTTFRTDGSGLLRIADVDLGVKWRSRSPHHVFEITSVTVRPWATPEPLRSPLEQAMTTVIGHDGLEDEYPQEQGDDAPAFETTLALAAAVAPEPELPSAVDRVPVSVVAELGTLTMSLGSLRHLRIGSLIKLGGRGEDEVVLRAADGPALAYAELVDIGGHVGLQISRLADA